MLPKAVPIFAQKCSSLSRLFTEEASASPTYSPARSVTHHIVFVVLSSPGLRWDLLQIHCMSVTTLGNSQHGGPENTDPHTGHWKASVLPSTRDGCISHTSFIQRHNVSLQVNQHKRKLAGALVRRPEEQNRSKEAAQF